MSALLSKQKFTKEKFKVYHPGGNIGKTLLLVKDIMITGNKIPLINFNNNMVSALKTITKKYLLSRTKQSLSKYNSNLHLDPPIIKDLVLLNSFILINFFTFFIEG